MHELPQVSSRRKFLTSGLKAAGGIATLGISTAAVLDGRQRSVRAYQAQVEIPRTSTASADIETRESATNQSLVGAGEMTIGMGTWAGVVFLGARKLLKALVGIEKNPPPANADTLTNGSQRHTAAEAQPMQAATIFQFPPSGS